MFISTFESEYVTQLESTKMYLIKIKLRRKFYLDNLIYSIYFKTTLYLFLTKWEYLNKIKLFMSIYFLGHANIKIY